MIFLTIIFGVVIWWVFTSLRNNWHDMTDSGRFVRILVLIVAVILCFICFKNVIVDMVSDGGGSSSGYYDNAGRKHNSQYEADVWNDVDDWMAENW